MSVEVVVPRMLAIAGHLPAVCICCGASTQLMEVREGSDLASRLMPLPESKYRSIFDWGQPSYERSVSLSYTIASIAAKASARKMRIRVPVCDVHLAGWKRRARASLYFKIAFIFTAPLLFGYMMYSTTIVSRGPWLALAIAGALGLALSLTIAVRRNGGFTWPDDFRIRSITDAEIHFVNVSPRFAAGIETLRDAD